MVTTTSYGTIANYTNSLSVEDYIGDAIGSFGDDGYDVDGIAREFRETINAALPNGVSLAGNEFYGPYYEADRGFEGYPLSADGNMVDIAAIIESVDFWGIVERHVAIAD